MSLRPPGRREDVLDALRSAGGSMTITELAARVEVHPNTVRFHLSGLLDQGTVVQVAADPQGPGRPAQRYAVAAGMDPAGPRHYEVLAGILAGSLAGAPDAARRARAAGRAWGRCVPPQAGRQRGRVADPVDGLVALMDGLGFAPRRASDPAGRGANAAGRRADRIDLHGCPFLELARAEPTVVCAIHLGLMQGALSGWGADTTVRRLDPFVEPGRCVARLAPMPGARSQQSATPASHREDRP